MGLGPTFTGACQPGLEAEIKANLKKEQCLSRTKSIYLKRKESSTV